MYFKEKIDCWQFFSNLTVLVTIWKRVWMGKDIKYFGLEISVETFQIPGVSWEQVSLTKAPEVVWLSIEKEKPKNLDWMFATDFFFFFFWALLTWGP